MPTKKLAILIVCVVLIAAGAYFCIWCFAAPNEDFKYIAHRGYSDKYYENTEAAFRGAAEEDFWGIETDIRVTKDGFLVCHHDEEATFNDGTSLTVAEATLAELTAKPLGGDGTDDGSYIPTFSSYLRVCKEAGKFAVVEMKDPSYTDAAIDLMLAEIDTYYSRANCNIISFHEDVLQIVRAKDADIKIFYLVHTFDNKVKDLCFENDFNLSINKKGLSNRSVRKFHEHGLEVSVWTVEENLFLARAKWNDVDYVTCNSYLG